MLCIWRKGQKKLIKNTLFHRTLLTCKNNNINLSNYVLDKHYAGRRKYLFITKIMSGQDGLIDTIRNCILFYDSDIQISKTTNDFIIHCSFNYERGPSLLF